MNFKSRFTVALALLLISFASQAQVQNFAYKPAESMDRMFHMPFDNDRKQAEESGVLTIAEPAQ